MEIQKDNNTVSIAGSGDHLGCKGPYYTPSFARLHSPFFIFFCQNSPQGKFSGHYSKSAAPLHPFNLLFFNINMLIRVQWRVQRGALGCNGGGLEGSFRPLHPEVNQRQSLQNPQKVQGCKGSDALKQFPEVVFPSIKWKKNTLFIYTFLVLIKQLECCYYWGSRHPVLCRCQPVLVTWLTGQTKGRNERALVTAHNYKLCGMGIVWLHSIKGSWRLVCQNSAVRNQLPQFKGRDRASKYPSPPKKLITSLQSHPPYGFINCSEFSNSFLFLVLCFQLLFLGARGGNS